MANTVQVRRGANASLPTLNAGEFGFSTDTHQIYIGDGAANHELLQNVVEDTTPQLGGTLEVLEHSIQLDHALGTDHHWSGITITGVAGVTTTFGQLLFLSNSTDRWIQTDADFETHAGDVMLGINVDDATSNDGDTIELLLYGFVRDDSRYDFGSGGDALYVSCTIGELTATRPSGEGDIIRVVGYAHDDADTIFFNPSGTWVEV